MRLFLLIAVGLTGCTALQLATETVDVGVAELSGVTVRVIGTDGSDGVIGDGNIRYNRETGTVDVEPYVTFGDVKVEMHLNGNNRQLIVNGHPYGEVTPGDKVVVTEDRRVEVNGEERHPPNGLERTTT